MNFLKNFKKIWHFSKKMYYGPIKYFMPVTQAHILMLASVSIFTGMIAPGAANHEISQPYALTNIQYIAFIVLFVLSGLFLASNLRMKKTSHALSALLILLIILLAVMTALGIVKSFSGLVLSSFHWGWFFLMSGLCLLAFSVIKSAAFDREKWENPYEKIMGITGFLVLLILTSFVITVAILNQKKGKNISELTKIFTGTEISSFSGITISPAFRKIEHFSANRAKNIFSFVGYNSSNSAFLYPEKLPLSDPFSIEKIIRVAKNIYFVKKDGSVFRGQQKVGKYIPPADEKSAHNFLFLQVSDDKYRLITDNFYEEYTIPAQKIDGVFFDNSSQMLYSRVSSPNGQAIYRGENRVTKEYHSILRFAISREGNILLVLEKENGEKMIVLDEKNQYALREDYVPGTFQTNGIDTLYAIKNLEDSSFSVVFNGVVLERKLDEIRDMFLSEKSNFGYF